MELTNINISKNIIEDVEPNSIGKELGIEPGDILLSINGNPVRDIIDYKYLISDEYIELEIEKDEGEIWLYEIEKEYDEDLGIIFTNPLIDRAKSCSNKCIFCFIDQLPPNMRESLYFKDDDSRLSFLQGNFITLTNMSDEEIDRIIKYRLSPINISVHTTNPKLRVKMLRNRKAGNILEILKKFHQAQLEINCQIVLVPGFNDGEELDKTLTDLAGLHPSIKSVAVVPVGITKYRERLTHLTPYTSDMAKKLLEQVLNKQEYFLKELGTRFVFPSDEFFALSSKDLPKYEEYENFPQLENGVGLLKLFKSQVMEELEKIDEPIKNKGEYIIATGTLAYEFMKDIAKKVNQKFQGLKLTVVPIINQYFGEKITVSGLITGTDLVEQLKSVKADGIIIPKSMMKSDEDIFLDSVDLEDVAKKLERHIIVSPVRGKDFIDILRIEVSK